MSTRGLMGLVIDGVEKLAYNHFDSYPGGLGEDVLKWAREATAPESLAATIAAARALVVVSTAEPTPEQVEHLRKWANTDVGTKDVHDWYVLLRETQGRMGATLEAGYMEDGASFACDSLSCEWGYVVDLDALKFEVYRGFQTSPHTDGRFAGRTPEPHTVGEYYPIRLIASYVLGGLPENLDGLESEDDDDEEDVP